VVGSGTRSPLPWLDEPLRRACGEATSHAMLFHGPEGIGQFEFTFALAQAFLCEARAPGATPELACGVCAGCRLFAARTHPDLLVAMPEAHREALGWSADTTGDETGAATTNRAKPSKEIRVDEIRGIIAFAQQTSSRGRDKVVIVFPAEQMNPIASNALLKTLEEPVGRTRFMLSSAAPDALLPTVRSRCQAFALNLPPATVALAWLSEQGVKEPEVLLAACAGQPIAVVEWVRLGMDAPTWKRLPGLVAQGDPELFADWPLGRVVETLQKLCHDSLCFVVGAPPRYFPPQSLGGMRDLAALTEWAAQLRRDARQCDHPWNQSLKIGSLVQQGQRALECA
jgi:DNA polymerase III subunit delta'